MLDAPIYHICRRSDWEAPGNPGFYNGPSDADSEDFLHFSTRDQVVESAARHWAGVDGLVLVTVDAGRLGTHLRWEPARGGILFPHLYGPLPRTAVLAVDDLPLASEGGHVFPFFDKH